MVDQVGFGNSGWVWWVRLGLEVSLGLVGQAGFAKSGWVCFHWLILPCIALMLKLEFRWWGGVGGGADRFSCHTHNQVALGCFWVGLLLLGLALGL